jgi:hypothetical protein
LENIKNLIIVILGLGISVYMSIIVMINGWGLEPKSYFWIIAVGVGGQLLAHLIIMLGKPK